LPRSKRAVNRILLNDVSPQSLMRTPKFIFCCLLGFVVQVGSKAQSPTPTPARSAAMAEAGNAPTGYDMAPETRPEVVAAAVAAIPTPLPPGPVRPTWESVKAYYRVPQWFVEAKFGIFLHWGLYSVPAYHNEWYEKYMYSNFADWHRDHFGPQDKFGYKDFIPLFSAAKFDPDAWAELFRKSGAKYVIPTAQHHDGFALWDSSVTPWNAKAMGPHRDLIGELAQAVRKQGLKFGVSNHGIENFQFVNPKPELEAQLKAEHADLYDPRWAGFYNVADRSDAACEKFLVNWYERVTELVDKYRPDLLWFDNGVDIRYLDPLKLMVAAYYYNRAAEWGKEVSITTKKAAYAPSGKNTEQIGSIVDFERIGVRSPAGIRPGVWHVDDPIGTTWGYTSDMRIAGPSSVIAKLVDTVSKNGNLTLNLSPRADGTIPEAQQTTLLAVGQWLDVNGEAIYGTHNWIRFSDGRSDLNVRFTAKGDALYAIILGEWPGHQVVINSLVPGTENGGSISAVSMLGNPGSLKFIQNEGGLTVELPEHAPCRYAFALKISGLTMNAPTATADGNP
jgi:alpha-L-fucosidase